METGLETRQRQVDLEEARVLSSESRPRCSSSSTTDSGVWSPFGTTRVTSTSPLAGTGTASYSGVETICS